MTETQEKAKCIGCGVLVDQPEVRHGSVKRYCNDPCRWKHLRRLREKRKRAAVGYPVGEAAVQEFCGKCYAVTYEMTLACGVVSRVLGGEYRKVSAAAAKAVELARLGNKCVQVERWLDPRKGQRRKEVVLGRLS